MGTNLTLTASDGHSLAAYRAEPEGTPRGGIVVIQEIFGVNGHIREVADGYAAAGYLAVAPALYDRDQVGVELGYEPDDITAGLDHRSKVPMEGTLADIAAAAAVAAECGKVGAVGYCWGGALAAASSVELAEQIQACVGYYGGGIAATLLDRSPVSPLLLHFGEHDHGIPLEDVDKIRAAWTDATVHVYDGAEHGFNCDQRASFHAQASRVALARTLRFFGDHLS